MSNASTNEPDAGEPQMLEVSEPRTRQQRLLDGRRLSVGDLLSNGQLVEGDALEFHRQRSGAVHHAVVTADGHIRLDDGREFSSPSRAAREAAGSGAIDGWIFWKVAASGRTLDSLRQVLLDLVAQDDASDPPDESSELERSQAGPASFDRSQRHEELRRARNLADEGHPRSMVVRDLIAWWGARSRGNRINARIEVELDNHGLVTSPDFRKVTLETAVALCRPVGGLDTEGIVGSDAPTVNELVERPAILEDDGDELDVGITVGTFGPALGGVAFVTPQATIEEAITELTINDYSQLAVLAGRTLKGAVTWKSIAKARYVDPGCGLTAAVVSAKEVPYDQELIDVLETLFEHDFVFVRDQYNSVAGILTAADVVVRYGELATPFLLIGELDQTLRWMISQKLDFEDVVRICDPEGSRKLKSFDDLTFGDYHWTLKEPDQWQKLGVALDRRIFVGRLDEVRELRNEIMHFNSDVAANDDVAKIRHLLNALKEYR